MNKTIFLSFNILLVLALVFVSGCIDNSSEPSSSVDLKGPDTIEEDVLYQVSTIDALLEGLYGGQMNMAELKLHGDTGLGTFDSLDGEMVVIDGDVYQMRADGIVYPVDDTATTPFAAVTYFESDRNITLNEEMNSSEVALLIEDIMPSENLMYAIRIDGTFAKMTVRSVPAQEQPFPLLVDVIAEDQVIFELEDVGGSIVGFWLPYYVEGINVPGYHFHFIDSGRERGGHVLDYVILNGTVHLDSTAGFELSLPESTEFINADLARDKGDELHTVEKNDG